MSEQAPKSTPAAIPHWYDPEGDVLDITDGDGAYVTDADGDRYLDFVAQLYCSNAGHSNQAIIDAMGDQLERIPYVSPSKHNDTRSKLATELADIAPGSLSDVFFSISGSEANEAAIQIARDYMDAPKVLTRWRSYHGSTYAAGALTGDPGTRATLERYAAVTGVTKFLPPMGYNSPFNADSPEELAELAADHLEFVIRNEGPDSIAAILTEPIAGTNGAYTAPPGYFERVRELCDEYDILLISDEVITGFGRCGDWFGIGTEGVEPDMITFAKGVTGAYSPLAGVIAQPEIAAHVHDEGFSLGQTFGGHPVSCAAGLAAIDEYRGGLIDNVVELAPYFEERLNDLMDAHDVVGDVRGRGFHWGIEFSDPETGEPFFDPRVDEGENPVSKVIAETQQRGVLVGGGRPTFQIVLSPPLTVDKAEIDEAVDALEESIVSVFE